MNFKILFDGNREFMRRIEKLEVDRGFEKNEAKESIGHMVYLLTCGDT